MPQTTVTENVSERSDGTERVQYTTTVPKGLVEAFDLGGCKIEWEVETGNALRVEKVSENE